MAPGWLAVTSPVPMQLREDGKLIGTTRNRSLCAAVGATYQVANTPRLRHAQVDHRQKPDGVEFRRRW